MMNKYLILIICIILFSSQGCIFFNKEIMTLKRAGDSQKQISSYIKKQVKLFDKLVGDLKNDKLKPGVSKSSIISIYGDPVLITKKPAPLYGEVLLYRHPTEFFNSDKVYLYFDGDWILIGWEYEPANSPPSP